MLLEIWVRLRTNIVASFLYLRGVSSYLNGRSKASQAEKVPRIHLEAARAVRSLLHPPSKMVILPYYCPPAFMPIDKVF